MLNIILELLLFSVSFIPTWFHYVNFPLYISIALFLFLQGYRYELWCLARASGIRYCVVSYHHVWYLSSTLQYTLIFFLSIFIWIVLFNSKQKNINHSKEKKKKITVKMKIVAEKQKQLTWTWPFADLIIFLAYI